MMAVVVALLMVRLQDFQQKIEVIGLLVQVAEVVEDTLQVQFSHQLLQHLDHLR